MNKAYSRIMWVNYPNTDSPLNATNLNRMDASLDILDDRVISLNTTKLDAETAAGMVSNISFDSQTGIFTVTSLNGSSFDIDTKLEKLAVNFGYDPDTEKLIIALEDGTTQEVDLSSLITIYEFLDSDTIYFVLDGGKVKANIVEGSISEKHLRPDYLADIRIESAKAQASASNAAKSEAMADASEESAKSYAGQCKSIKDYIDQKIEMASFDVDENGNLIYTDNLAYIFTVDDDGYLNWEVA